MAERGFWKRIRDDYHSRQVIFEVKNFEELGPDEFRQVLSYTSGEYGNFAVIVSRSQREIPSDAEKGWIRTMWHEHQRMILILTAETLARCVSKLRSDRKYDYSEDALGKRMDLFVRSFLNLSHEKHFRVKKRK